ncbi:MAG TPA: hypothetical protein VF538_13745 [Pyrinomonadaceae bacterium]|jgi:hypothetical protein
MTDESKKRIATICIYASAVLLLPALYGMLFVEPEPGWSKLCFALGIAASLVGSVLVMRAKRGD